MADRVGRNARRMPEVIIERHYKLLLWPIRREGPPQGNFVPVIPARVDQRKLVEEIVEFFALPKAHVEERLRTYQEFHELKGYARTLGEFKTLCSEEAFVLFVLMATKKPRTLACIGAGDGSSLRRLLDIKELLGFDCKVVSFDIIDHLRYCTREEANLAIGDLQGRFSSTVLNAYEPGVSFVDIHTYPLLSEIVRQTLAHRDGWLLAMHDCGRGLCNPQMTLLKNDPNVTSTAGVWERHVLAQTFGVGSPSSEELDRVETTKHTMRIFTSPHGLAVIQLKGEQR
jgi:hypothetical protein